MFERWLRGHKALGYSRLSSHRHRRNDGSVYIGDAEGCLSFRLQGEDATKFASSLARAKEANALDVEVEPWFERNRNGFSCPSEDRIHGLPAID
jgi:hypothetical protein